MSNLALAKTTPVNPPKVNKKINPVAHIGPILSTCCLKGRP